MRKFWKISFNLGISTDIEGDSRRFKNQKCHLRRRHHKILEQWRINSELQRKKLGISKLEEELKKKTYSRILYGKEKM